MRVALRVEQEEEASVILRVEDVYKHFPLGGLGGQVVRAVDGVSFEVRKGESAKYVNNVSSMKISDGSSD